MARPAPEAGNAALLKWIHDSLLAGDIEAMQSALRESSSLEEFGQRGPAPVGEIIGLIDPKVEIDASHAGLPLGGTEVWRGHQGWFRFWADWLETWEDFDYETSNFQEVGNAVVMDLTVRGRGRESGVPVEGSFTQVWEFQKGRVVRMRPFMDRDQAMEAVRRE